MVTISHQLSVAWVLGAPTVWWFLISGCCGTFCTPCLVYRNANDLGKSGCLYALLACFFPCIPLFLLRDSARERYGIEVRFTTYGSWPWNRALQPGPPIAVLLATPKKHATGIKIRALSRGTSLGSHFDDSFFIGKFANLKNAIIKDYLVMAQVVEHWTRVSKVLTSNRCGSWAFFRSLLWISVKMLALLRKPLIVLRLDLTQTNYSKKAFLEWLWKFVVWC